MLKIELNLSEEDLNRVITVLKRYISDLSMEIADTDRQSFREDLKKRKAVLEKALIALTIKRARE